MHIYEVRPRKDHRGVNLISDALPLGPPLVQQIGCNRECYRYAKFYGPSRDAVIRAYDDAGNVIATHEHAGEFKDW